MDKNHELMEINRNSFVPFIFHAVFGKTLESDSEEQICSGLKSPVTASKLMVSLVCHQPSKSASKISRSISCLYLSWFLISSFFNKT
jgi:hypothetical protein